MSTTTKTQLTTNGSGAMFDNIAPRYDFVNRIISMGLDQRWRKTTVRRLEVHEGAKVLDLATGTGDLGLMVLRKHPSATVTGLDPSPKMLEIGRQKAARKELTEKMSFECGDSQALPFADNSFDRICMAFGIRNVPDRALALREMARVGKPGALVAILELSEPRNSGLFSKIASFHIHKIIPRIGALLSGSKEYLYLQESIAAFPPAKDFVCLMDENGMHNTVAIPMTLGVCHLYVGRIGGA